jgi:hypothetical protein
MPINFQVVLNEMGGRRLQASSILPAAQVMSWPTGHV